MYTAQGTLDPEATVEKYAPMVKRLANQLVGRLPASVDVGDMIQAGMLGLMDAMTRFDEEGGAQFETFATQRVRGAMLDELRSTDWFPRSVRKAQRQLETAVQNLEQRLMRTASEAEIASELELSIEEYRKMLGDARGAQLFYLEDLNNGGDSDGSFFDKHVQADPSGLTSMLSDERFRDALIGAIQKLPEREQQVMAMYYEQELTLKEIGRVFDVTESRVSQIHSQAVGRLRGHLKAWR